MNIFEIVLKIEIKGGDPDFILDAISEQLERGEDILDYEIKEVTQ